MIKRIEIHTPGQGLHEFTFEVENVVRDAEVTQGLCTVFIQHTSASLLIQENADRSAKKDLEAWLNRLAPEKDSLYTHIYEGPDDMPSHIKSALTATSLGIPIMNGALALGTWQGIYLWEHRKQPKKRSIIVSVVK